ncbi:MAG: SpoIIE family protein phosphatase [Candidatus Aminicenantes bacterium]|nr:SpoIIE family protein phosphatase [Candidatus Aminicenantes bacterium]
MPHKILVVDDEPEWAKLIKKIFKKQTRSREWKLIFAENGREALEKLEKNPDVEVVLLDINMPEMDGLTFLKKLNKMKKPITRKTIIITGYGDMEKIRRAMNEGAFDFLNKPVPFDDLKKTIEKALTQVNIVKEALRKHDELVALKSELEIASRIQESMLPQKFPPFPQQIEFDIYAKMIPAKEVGGDFYDFFFIDQDRLAFVLGDVRGKGIPAALYMAKCCALLKTTAIRVGHPGECLERVNYRLKQENENFPGLFVTVFYGVLNFRSGILKYSCGGHHAPFLLSNVQGVQQLSQKGGLPLGLSNLGEINFDYEVEKIQLQKGDTILCYTDGVTDAENSNNKHFGDDKTRLPKHLERLKHTSVVEIVKGLIKEINEFSAGISQSDDITILALRYH